MSAPEPVTAVIVAAGSGSRMGDGVPKQYRMLGGKAVLAHAVDSLSAHPRVTKVRVVIAADHEELARQAIGERDVNLVTGGAERHDSVRSGLAGLADGTVLIHDAARPFCPLRVIDDLLYALDDVAGAVPVLAVADTLARGDRQLDDMVDRARMLRVQTPQAFHVEDLLYAFEEVGRRAATDESSVLVAAGLKVATVPGDPALDKLTSAADWPRAEAMLAAALIPRTAMGYDVHAFAGPGPIMMGGIEIAHERGLAGHSDADVVLHALTDALLGTIAEGDIGLHFPPSDPQWKGASSDRFLAHAAALVRSRGGLIDHLDCTVICEAPRLTPYREAMRRRISEIAELPLDQISLKATTSERLGFTGRGEGIAAQAVASVRLPQ
ncbi:bifunctional 2-C-methyl-D-erythritol 4-phosphate cytidylyltransferase/2-C-methyl-D-erythritol 2,4-cyclodiphosphate synthase [Sphingomonas mesophila]|uniref:bifunctional 2-C-methyl-D-erythritol 4-phosphate cytidylyltransferase/2-C-methyl-D-erythritol 2,4-cyclodiphosphate synthase n=1 Tax=Sphingomonas mesophila TaxID=2303576 RepID=UPI000E57606D|nr:bifunctional 2-C-methyl-D-erythritol 4-phosphate cytidylyltransferase/2-C-methyl-D-erythritol 2,4-cyclodiphosphate synthase [Sphingomonas mesophila]